MFLVFIRATGFGLDFDHHSSPLHLLQLFKTRNAVTTWSKSRRKTVALINTKNITLALTVYIVIIVLVTQRDDLY